MVSPSCRDSCSYHEVSSLWLPIDDAGDGVDAASADAADEDEVHLQCEGVDEVSSLAEVQAVQADEPVGGRDQLCQEGDLVMMMMNDSDVDLR